MWPPITAAEALAALPHPIDDDEDSLLDPVQHLPKPRALRPTIFPLHPILHTSPLTSPVLSRRSSSAGSCSSSKSVRFDGQSSFQFTHSREQYDRSPIIPSCEDLEIPSCKNISAGGWIRCLQRKAKEASEAGQPPPFISSVFSSGADCHPSGTNEESSPMSDVPPLVHDDYSSASESDDHVSPTTCTPPMSCADSFSLTSAQLSMALSSESFQSAPRSFCWDAMRPCDSDVYEDDCDEDCERDTIKSHSGANSEHGGDDEVEEDGCHDEGSDEEEDEDAEEGRFGMCGLGKFSRSSLYCGDDALGGF